MHMPFYHPATTRRRLAIVLAIGVGLASVALYLLAVEPQREPQEFRPVRVIRRPLPAIKNAPVVSREQADQTLHESELVLGVTVGGQSRAYPINMLTGPSREIINDRLAGQAIAATW